MDIYKWAEEWNCMADYYDPHTGNVYKVQAYGEAIKTDPNAKIAVYSSEGKFIGYARKE